MKRGLEKPGLATKLTIAAVAAYFLIFSALSILKYESFNSTAFDLGIFDQNVWMFSQGQTFINTINGFYPFADHIQPILYAVALLYKFAATPVLLLILHAAAVSLGAIPLYLLARKKLGEKIAVVFAIAYLIYPPTQYLTLFDFHTEAFLVTFLLSAVYFLETKSTPWMFAFLFLAGLTKEYIPVIFIFFAAYMLIVQKRAKAAAAAALIGAAWLFANYGIILDSYEFTSLHLYTESYGGDTSLAGKAAATASGLLSINKSGYVLLMLLPLAGLPLLGIEFLIFSIPGFALVLLKSSTTYKSVINHHTGFILPFLFAAAVLGFKRAVSIAGEKKKKLITAALIILSVASLVSYGPFTALYNFGTFNAWSSHAKAGRELVKIIPANADVAVSATTWAVPHLSERKWIYMFPAPFANYDKSYPEKQVAEWFSRPADYVVLDTSRKDVMLDAKLIAEQSCNVAKSGNYSVVYDSDGWVLLEKSARGTDPVKRLCGSAE